MRYLLFLAALLNLNRSFADGAPLDSNGYIFQPYISFALTESQKNQLEFRREIDLTSEQLALIGNPLFPKRIEIRDPHYIGCTCMLIYGIWFVPDSVAILKKLTAYDFTDPDLSELLEADMLAPTGLDSTAFFIGNSGKLYFEGTEINYNQIQRISVINKLETICVYLPPKRNNAQWNSVQATLHEIELSVGARFDVIVL